VLARTDLVCLPGVLEVRLASAHRPVVTPRANMHAHVSTPPSRARAHTHTHTHTRTHAHARANTRAHTHTNCAAPLARRSRPRGRRDAPRGGGRQVLDLLDRRGLPAAVVTNAPPSEMAFSLSRLVCGAPARRRRAGVHARARSWARPRSILVDGVLLLLLLLLLLLRAHVRTAGCGDQPRKHRRARP
jgi:hypothetical protein